MPGPVERVKALPVNESSIMVAWRPPETPNGIITKYTISMEDRPNDHLQVIMLIRSYIVYIAYTFNSITVT